MKKLINIYKLIGPTPKQLIEEYRVKNPEYKDIKIGFAGRLDPLAHGVMLLMIGDETKNRNQYLNLDKEYEFEVLFGVSTDTYDALGIVNNLTIQQYNNLEHNLILLKKKIKEFLSKKVGKHHQPYPPYSSKPVSGKPLFQWARENRLSEITIPKKEIEIYKFDLLEIKKIKMDEIKKRIIDNINKVYGDFRQKEILENWENFFSSPNNETMEQPALPAGRWNNLVVAKFRISCSSGTYVRSIANEMGNFIGSGSLALSILRTGIDGFKLNKSLKL